MQIPLSRVLSAVLAVVCVFLGIRLYQASVERRRLSSKYDVVYWQAKDLEKRAASCVHEADSLNARLASLAPSPIEPLYVDRLRKLGLDHPVEDLASDLQRHAELIPYPATHGRMGFNDRDRIRVLSEAWVYATFEDGLNGGEAILGYEVAPGGKISWRMVKARMED